MPDFTLLPYAVIFGGTHLDRIRVAVVAMGLEG